ncbi:alpha/beta hydrolase [Sphingomonas mucosissima]|uniref:Monoterpene epsilon-lactone hydrolase n=1 Tax=Sphingomonas mucosissima TaxID=370959 RepID=A0A245ZSY1_9SPHN|nr:alpha/beta hydrolase fold domain-containing protein [Sphingomonas mucosissima]OWK32861.1 monoterpene epsilon-lactone hydrolase [Sphingomonas mucosissima]
MKSGLVMALLMLAAPVAAQTVKVPAMTLPPSTLLSNEAKRVIVQQQAIRPPDFGDDIAAARAFWGRYNDDRLAEMRRHFRTAERRERLGGVVVDVVTPANGPSMRNAERVLINVHGGAFMWGSGSGALVEAIPIAATMGITVVTVDYRLAPEHRYPAASQDIAAVYRELLKRYRPENIGIYGCSAGGVITAQSVAWFQRHHLPRPGAVGTFCGTGGAYAGDSAYLSDPLTTGKPMRAGALPTELQAAYMKGIPADDPLAYPLGSDAVMRQFPPTLHLAGSRDFASSVLTWQHRRLSALGVKSELQIFDGLGHAFFVWPNMPESIEAFRLVSAFFDRHLGAAPADPVKKGDER